MVKNYLKIAFRNLFKQKLYAVVNIVGLAVGLACVILILRYVQYELSFDTFHEKADQIHRIVQRQPGNVFLGSDHFAVTPAPLAQTLVSEFPEVLYATTIDSYNALLSHSDQHFYEDGLRADEHVFQVFTFPMIQGNPETALAEPNTIVLTASLAAKIFGDEDPMGKILIHQNEDPFTVTGVIEDVPANAHFTFSYITSIRSQENYVSNLERNSWNSNSWFTYFVVQEDVSQDQLQAKMPAFTQKYLADDEDDPDDPNERNQYIVQALTSIHLYSHVNFEMSANNDIKYIYLFSAIALVILLIACVNYMNLATARSITRAKEVGMRKVVGAHRGQLIRQFIGESMLMVFFALVLALILVHVLLPIFGRLVERDLALNYAEEGWLLLGLGGIGLVVSLFAGSYPALFMSALRPIHVLKGALGRGVRRSRLRSLLVVGQYTISIVLVIGSLVIYQQLRFIQNKELGYDREHVVVMPIRDRAVRQNTETIKNELRRHADVISVSTSSHLPARIASSTTVERWEGSSEGDELAIYQANIDYDFLDVFELELAEGRNYSRDFPSDTVGAFLLNETAVKALGWDTAIGKQFHYWRTDGPVIGVVKDFHMHSLHQPIQPLMLRLGGWVRHLSVKIRPQDIPGTLDFLEETMAQFSPYPFEYEFLDETFDQLYKTELRLGEAFGYFTLLALLIASMGLFGLAAFAAERRTKEIGVRKVMGASVPGVILLLSKGFTKLVAVAFVLAAPVAYFAMNHWLEDFAYRVDLSWPIFVVAGLAALLVSWLSVGYQSMKAARVNPVESLRYE